MQVTRSAPGMAVPQQQAPNDMELDDDELLDMMGDIQPEPHTEAGQPVSASMQAPITDTLAGKLWQGVVPWAVYHIFCSLCGKHACVIICARTHALLP